MLRRAASTVIRLSCRPAHRSRILTATETKWRRFSSNATAPSPPQESAAQAAASNPQAATASTEPEIIDEVPEKHPLPYKLPKLPRGPTPRREKVQRPIPPPREGMDVKAFFKMISTKHRPYEEFVESKATELTWEELFTLSGRDLKKKNIPIRQRRWILRWVEKYRQGILPTHRGSRFMFPHIPPDHVELYMHYNPNY